MKKQTLAAWLLGEGIKKLAFTVPAVTYQDGKGGSIFGSQTTLCLSGGPTPRFIGTPERDGWIFKKWFPEVADTVTSDAVYTALWEEIPVCSVSYSDGMDASERGVMTEVRPGPVYR